MRYEYMIAYISKPNVRIWYDMIGFPWWEIACHSIRKYETALCRIIISNNILAYNVNSNAYADSFAQQMTWNILLVCPDLKQSTKMSLYYIKLYVKQIVAHIASDNKIICYSLIRHQITINSTKRLRDDKL